MAYRTQYRIKSQTLSLSKGASYQVDKRRINSNGPMLNIETRLPALMNLPPIVGRDELQVESTKLQWF